MEFNLLRLYELNKDKNKLLEQLRLWKLIPLDGEYLCFKCGGILKLSEDPCHDDGFTWICENTVVLNAKRKREKCGTCVELRLNTFFERSELPIFKILAFVSLWLDNLSLPSISKQLDLAFNICVDWAAFCREIVLDWFILNKNMFGGWGKVIEIYQSKFSKRKFHRGHYVKGKYVFGGYERGTGNIFMVCVEDRGSDTLLPVICDWIEEGTTLVADYWKTYKCSRSEAYQNLKVSLSLSFKDPETLSHANSIKSARRAMKSYISPERWKTTIPGDLACFLFQKRCKELKLNIMDEFFKMASQMNDPTFSKHYKGEDVDTDGFSDIE